VPKALVIDLMREKKDRAIATKFWMNNRPPDRITNMEGAMHTFVTPVVETLIIGDYQWRNGHSLAKFGESNGKIRGRKVLLSCLVQQDYEDENVMVRVASLSSQPIHGRSKFPDMLHWYQKQDDSIRRVYNTEIHRYLVHHLTFDHQLPSANDVEGRAMNVSQAVTFLEDILKQIPATVILQHVRGKYFVHQGRVFSLEIMLNTSIRQVKNEFVLLDKLCNTNGWVYTFNPPAIFVRFFGSHGTQLLSRLHGLAIKYVKQAVRIKRLKTIGWDDFGDSTIISLLQIALTGFTVRANSSLFSGGKNDGLYRAPLGEEKATLVIHNNSDAFGQNIETEAPGGSLDGVIGAYSSAAASLLRHRKDLCNNLLEIYESG
jgi:hypothetical protein